MRYNFGPRSWIYPQAVYVIGTYDEEGHANAMNAAWGGICGEKQIMLCLSAEHKTTKNILLKKAFTVGIGTLETKDSCDFVGLLSANYEHNSDKMERAGFTTEKAQFVDAPIILELPMVLECHLISYDETTGHLFGEIENINIDKKILTNGKPDPEKLKPIIYDPIWASYHVLGEKVGKAFSDGKKLR